MNIRVHIDELVLHGFAPGDRHGIAEAVQVELTRMLIETGVPPLLDRDGRVERLNAGSFDMSATAKPETAGAQIAQTVYGGLARG